MKQEQIRHGPPKKMAPSGKTGPQIEAVERFRLCGGDDPLSTRPEWASFHEVLSAYLDSISEPLEATEGASNV